MAIPPPSVPTGTAQPAHPPTAQAMNDSAKIQTAAERVLRVEPTNYKALMAIAGAQFAAADYRKATQRVYHAPDRASFIDLPVAGR